jgi:hypothetical protein
MFSPYLENPFFHHKQKGCQVIKKKYPASISTYTLIGGYCITHKIDVCGCGLSWDHGLTDEERFTKQQLKNETLTATEETL